MMIQFSKTSFIFFLMFLVFLPPATQAETVKIVADGEYVMGDNDTSIIAKLLALEDAKRNILEKVGTYIESTTEVKNGIVKSDDVKQYTAGIVKVETIKEERRLLENKATLISLSVCASVDPSAVVQQVIELKNRKDVAEKARKFSEDNIRLRKEIALLNQQLRQISNENQSQELITQRSMVLKKIDENEKGLTMLVSGESLVQMSLLDRQKQEGDKQIISRFLNEVADAYRVSSEEPLIEDNGDGTSNVTISYSLYLPGNYDNTDNVSINVPTNREFLSKGFIIKSFLDGGLIIRCHDNSSKRCKTILGPYFEREVGKISLVIQMGNLVKKIGLNGITLTNNKHYVRNPGRRSSGGKWVNDTLRYTLFYKESSSYTFEKIGHEELKSISTIEIFVRYN